MQNGTHQLESADLDVMLTFPQGNVGNVAAQLTVKCRKSNLTVARISMTANDLADFLAGRTAGGTEGESQLLNARGRTHLNSERVLVSVSLPHAVDVFDDPADGRHLTTWAEGAMRAYGAHDFRITNRKEGYLISLAYFVPVVDDGARMYAQLIQEKLAALAKSYGDLAIEKKSKR